MMRHRKLLFSVVPLLALWMFPTQLPASSWYEFSFTQVMVPAEGCYPKDPSPTALDCIPSSGNNSSFLGPAPWVFNMPHGGFITITDAFLAGDQFEVFENGVSIGTTPLVAIGGGCGSDPDVCVLNPNISHATFALAAGMDSITIEPLVMENPGAAYFSVSPEPGTCLLFATGAGVLLRRRRWKFPPRTGIA